MGSIPCPFQEERNVESHVQQALRHLHDGRDCSPEVAVETFQTHCGGENAVVCFLETCKTETQGSIYMGLTSPAHVESLRLRLKEILPPHLVPSTFVTLLKLPRTAMGIIDRSRLRDMGASNSWFPFWETSFLHNAWDRTESHVQSLSPDVSSLLLDDCKWAPGAGPIDIVLGALACTFSKAFPSHPLPPVFTQSCEDGNVSTEKCLSISLAPGITLVEAVRTARDARRLVQTLPNTSAIGYPEISLKFRGISRSDPESHNEISHHVTRSLLRVALIEVEAKLDHGQIVVSIHFPKDTKHQVSLQTWAQTFIQALNSIVHDLSRMGLTFTKSDFPLVDLSSRGLKTLQHEQLPHIGVSPADVVDVCPCSPLQEGVLLSSSSYAVYWVWQCLPHGAQKIDTDRLEMAWKTAIGRHKIFSTIFTHHPEKSGFVQIVLNRPEIRVRQMSISAAQPATALSKMERPCFGRHEPKHMFTICQSETGETFCRLDICHTIFDHYSLSILLQDVQDAYSGRIPTAPPPFSKVVEHIQSKPKSETVGFWTEFLRGVKPCIFPVLRSSSAPEMQDIHDILFIPRECLGAATKFCQENGITRSTFMHLAWGLVLSYFTHSDQACFGYMASGRDAPVEGIERICGPLANMIVSCVDLKRPLQTLIKSTAAMLKEHRHHQQTSLAEVQHRLAVPGARLFNTMVSLIRVEDSSGSQSQDLSFQKREVVSPQEFDLVVEGFLHPDSMDLAIYYRKAFVNRGLAEEVAAALIGAVNYLVSQEGSLHRESSIEPHGDGATECLSDAFFRYLVGSDQRSTKAFWEGQIVGYPTTDSEPLKDLTSPQPEKEYFEMESDELQFSSSFSEVVVARASWAVAMAQIHDSRHVSFGTNAIGRQARIPGIKARRGSGQHIIPVTVALDWNLTFSQHLERLQTQMQEISKYEGADLHWIRQIGAEAYSACSFQSLFLFQSSHTSSEDVDSINNSSKLQNWSDYDTFFECQLTEGRLRTRIGFSPKPRTKSHCMRIARRFQHVFRLLSKADNGEKTLKYAMGICDRDLGNIWTWNANVPKAAGVCVYDLIKPKVLLHPDKTAICAWNGNLTYGQLDELSTNLAHNLVELGIGKGDTVPLFFEKSVWMPVAMLGIVKAGGTGLGLDPKQPRERLRVIAKQVRARLALSSKNNRDLALDVAGCDIEVVDSESLARDSAQNGQGLPEVDPSSILYTVFTSGSTGTPKGVLIPHASYSSALINQLGVWGIKDTSRVFDFSSYAFDAAWFNLLHTLSSGGCLCVASNDEIQNNLSACFIKYNVSVAFLTPSVARHIDPTALGSLETVMLGGEMVYPEDVALSSEKTRVKIIYGPSECTPMTTCHDLEEDRSIAIGRGHGVCTWVVNPECPDSLTPIGMVGELWLEGPVLGQGYLGDPGKTAAAFVTDPTWLTEGPSERPGRGGRLYRTGDLVRYRDDGTLLYVGRKDTQVKIRGQRLELSEVEKHVQVLLQSTSTDGRGFQVVAETIRPQETNNLMLIVFVSLKGSEAYTEKEHAALVQTATAGMANSLGQMVPAYMIPNAFIPIQTIPMNINGKTDRSQLRKVGVSAWKNHSVLVDESDLHQAFTDMERLLCEVWMSVLNLPFAAISANKPFTRLGGDSITAMQVVSDCRTRKVAVTVSDILREQTLQKIALRCTRMTVDAPAIWAEEEEDDLSPFDLSPIQMKFFEIFPEGLNHFNQSFILEMKRFVPSTAIQNALKAVINRHHMLRARYQKNGEGAWQQCFSGDSEPFIFTEQTVSSRSNVLDIGQKRQGEMDATHGPVFSADLFQVQGSGQMLLLSAHHLVVDLVSWRIIWNDIEEHIASGCFRSHKAPSFRSWCKLQRRMATDLQPDSVLPFEVPQADYKFWDMYLTPNIRSEAEDCIKALDCNTTELLLGDSNKALRTEALDIIIGSYAYSFRKAFSDRNMPAIFVEGHGREQSDNLALDVSGTVGWFTTMHPLPIELSADATVIDAVRVAKDTRRAVPGKGQPYFASRYYSEACQRRFQGHDNIELLLNFAGRYQQLESKDALFKLAEPFESGRTLEVVAASSSRMALVEANMAVQEGKLTVTFTYNTKMKHQDRLKQWFQGFMDALHLATNNLQHETTRCTLSDFDLLPVSYRGLDRLLTQQLPDMHIKPADVVDVYPATPLQEGILLSSQKGTSSYATFWIWKCDLLSGSGRVSPFQLEAAWRSVAKRHSILSTVFGPHPEGNGFIQILLADPDIKIAHLKVESGNLVDILCRVQRPQFAANQPEHAFTICESDNDVFCRLDINHTLVDGGSLTPIVQDIVAAYDQFSRPSPPAFKEMMYYLRKTGEEQIISFWANYLQGVNPCEVPVCLETSIEDREDTFTYIAIPSDVTTGILDFCKDTGITRAVFLQVAWAMALSQLTGMQEVCFGYLASGRNAQVDGVENMVGPLANMLVSRIDLRAAVANVLQTTSDNSIKHLEYQHASLAKIQHSIGLSGRRLFNTAMTVRQEDQFASDENRVLSLDYCTHQDPHEFDLLLSSRLDNENIEVSIQIRESPAIRQLGEQTVSVLTKAIEHLLKSPTVSQSSNIPDSLYHDFFEIAIGKDENSTLSFWKDYFKDLDVNCFPPLKEPQVRSLKTGDVSTRVSGLDSSGEDFTFAVRARAAWSIVAARNAGSSEALFGTAMKTNQDSPSSYCILPFRSKFSWEIDGYELLENTKKQIFAMEEFASCGSQIISRASEEASMAWKFQALFLVEDDTTAGRTDTLTHYSSYAIVIRCSLRDNEAELTIKYDTGMYSEAFARQIVSQLEVAIRWLSSARLRANKLRDAAGISSTELEQVWNWNKHLPKAVERCVHELIHDKAILNPDAAAVSAWDGDLTYEQLDTLSTDLAHHLLTFGIGSGHIVPLCFEKSMWAPVAMLGVMKTGAASVLMDITLPEERLRVIANQVHCHVMLSSASCRDLACRVGAEDLVVVNDEELRSLQAAEDDDLPGADPSDLIYAVFTSGSTGKPKGAVLSHRNMSSMVTYQQDALGLSSASRVYDFASYAFDVAWCNFVHALTSGGCLCIPSEADRKDNIEASMNALRANYAHITPTLLRYLDWSKLKTITVLNLSGEAVLARDKTIAGPGVRVINAYGPAETNVVSVQDLSALASDEVSIGSGTGACAWVVDVEDENRLAPISTIGELWVEGPLVGLGYLEDAQKTAAAFKADPTWLLNGSSNCPGRRGTLYRTGDLVRYNHDGSLEYMGRRDTQVKIRGQRVELGEVETHIRQALEKAEDDNVRNEMSNCRIIADMIRPRGMDKEMLVAFISLEGADDMLGEAHHDLVRRYTAGLSASLSTVLPAYSIPSAYIAITDVPLTATGKTDRRRLKEIGASKTAQQIAALGQVENGHRKPTTQTECMLQKLWAESLNIDPDSIGIDDSFFRIGGDSIGAMKLVSLARDQRLSITVQNIFQNPVLHRLSSIVSIKSSSPHKTMAPFCLLTPGINLANVRASVASLCHIKEEKILDILPCTPLQESLFSRSDVDVGTLVSRHVLEIHQGIDLEMFQDAWNQVVSRNPIMRTRIVHIPEQGYVQVVVDEAIEWFLGQSLDECTQYSLQHPAAQGVPLAKLCMVDSGVSRRDFVWEMHWALYDGWGLRLLLAEAEKIYFNTTTRPLENVAALTKYTQDLDKAKAMEFWNRQFANIQGSHFPLQVSTNRPHIDSELSMIAPDLQEGNGEFTAATIVRAALSLVIAENLNSNEAVFGATVTGRQAAVPGIERMAGPAFATLPIRVPIDWGMTAKQLLEVVHDQAVEMIPFEQTSLKQIRQAGHEAAAACNFQTLLVVQSAIKQGDFRSRDQARELFVEGLVAGKGAIVELGQRSGEYAMYVECQLGMHADMKLRICFDSTILEPTLAERIIGKLELVIRRLSNGWRRGTSVKDLMQSEVQ